MLADDCCARSVSRGCISTTCTCCRARFSTCRRRSACPYDCTLHDYYRDLSAIPPRHRGRALLRRARRHRLRRVPRAPARRSGASTSPRGAARSGSLLRGADRVIAPSQRRGAAHRAATFPISRSTSGRIRKSPPPPAPRIARVAMLGNLSPEKGLHVVAACARDARDARPAADVPRAGLDDRADPAVARTRR